MTTERRSAVALSSAAAKLLPRFIMHRTEDVSTIRLALERGDYVTIVRLGHNMRGNGHSYGFPEIALIGQRMEVAANTHDVAGVREQLAALEDWVARSAQRKA